MDDSINLLSNSSNYSVQYERRKIQLYSQIQILDLIFHNPSLYQKTFARKTLEDDAAILRNWLLTIKENLKAELELISTTSVHEDIQSRFN